MLKKISITLLFLISASLAHFDDSQMKTLTVSGHALSSSPPDFLIINYIVKSLHENPQICLMKISRLIKEAIAELNLLNILNEEITTSNFNLYMSYDNKYQNNNLVRIFKGYEVSSRFSIRTSKIDLAGKIVEVVVKSGISQLENIEFTLKPETKRKIEESIIEKAIANAKTKAEIALSALGEEIKNVKSIALDGNMFITPPPIMSTDGIGLQRNAAMATSVDSSHPFFAAANEISVTANVCFIIGPKTKSN